MIPDVYENEELYAHLMVGTAKSPGIVEIFDHDRDKGWDIKPAKGSTGASTVRNGDPPGEFGAHFDLYEPDDFERWPAFQFLLETMVDGPKPVALAVYHPLLALNRFSEVTVKKIGGMVRFPNGSARVTVRFLEYKPPKPKPAKKAEAAVRTGTTTVSKPDPLAEAEAQLAGLVAEARGPA